MQVFLMCALNMVAMPGGNRLFVGDLEAVAKLLNAEITRHSTTERTAGHLEAATLKKPQQAAA